MSLPISEFPKPWEHKIQLFPLATKNFQEQQGIRASCTCGDYDRKYSEGIDPAEILDQADPHTESHPMPPQAIATLGDDSLVLVMAVPGPEGNPVHMSISVSREIFDDAKKLAHYLGTIGSPLHFQIIEHREIIRSSMKSMQSRSVSMPEGVPDIERVIGLLRDMGHEVNRIGQINSDGSVDYIPVPQQKGPDRGSEIEDQIAQLERRVIEEEDE